MGNTKFLNRSIGRFMKYLILILLSFSSIAEEPTSEQKYSSIMHDIRVCKVGASICNKALEADDYEQILECMREWFDCIEKVKITSFNEKE